MTRIQSHTIMLGALLIILGLASFYSTGMASITALIPTFFGIFFVIFGLLARSEKLHDKLIRAGMGLAVLGVLGTTSGFLKLISLIGGAEIARPVAVYGQSVMFLLCAAYTASGVRYFKKKGLGEI